MLCKITVFQAHWNWQFPIWKFFFLFTCAIVTINKAGYVGFGLAGYQMWRTELFQHAIVIVLINLPLVVDPEQGAVTKRKKGKKIKSLQPFSICIVSETISTRTTTWSVPHILISSSHGKVLCLCWVDKNGVESYFFITLLHNHQFTAT